MSNPIDETRHADYLYDPDNWEATYKSDDAYLLTEEMDLRAGKVVRVCCLKKVPDLFVCELPTAFDGDGEAEDWDVRFFASEEEARAAIAKARGEQA